MLKKIKKIIENEYVFSVVARIIGVLTGLIYSIMYSRYLGPELRGEASVVGNTATLASLVMCLGIYQAYPYFRKTGNKKPEELYTEYINKICGLFLLYLCVCLILAFVLPVNTGLKISFVLMPLLMGIKELNYVVLIERPKLRNIASIILNVVDILIIGLLMVFTRTNYFICYAFLIAKEIIYFIIAFQNLRVNVFSIRPTLRGIMPYIKFGVIPMISVILMEVNYKVDVLMLNGHVSKAEIGVYSLGVQLAERLWLIPDALKDILLSKLSKGKGTSEVAKITRISLLAMLICIVLAILLGRPFVNILFGQEYSDAYFIMLVILASVIAMVFYKMVYSYNVANGKRIVNMVILGIAAASNVILNYILIPIMGNMGAAVASLVSYMACGFVFLIYFHKESDIPYKDIILFKRTDAELFKSVFRMKKG